MNNIKGLGHTKGKKKELDEDAFRGFKIKVLRLHVQIRAWSDPDLCGADEQQQMSWQYLESEFSIEIQHTALH